MHGLARPDGSELIFHLKLPSSPGRHPAFVYVGGSGCRTVLRVFTSSLDRLVAAGAALVAPEKRGVVDAGTRCSEEFLRTNDRHTRLADARLLLSALALEDPLWDGRAILVGASEGAQIAPELAAENESVVGLVLLGGGGMAQSRELEVLLTRRGERRGRSREQVDGELRELRAQFAAIRAAPDAMDTFMGRDNTYRRWASYLWYAPLEWLLNVEVPVFLAHGTNDEASPIESADAIAEAFAERDKRNLTYLRLDTDHGFADRDGRSHLDEVLTRVVRWARSRGLL